MAGQRKKEAGYLKTYFRPPGKIPFNVLNNLEMLNIDYAEDFVGDLHNPEYSYHTNYFIMRFQCLCETLFDLALM